LYLVRKQLFEVLSIQLGGGHNEDEGLVQVGETLHDLGEFTERWITYNDT
jgi:hypothetical protein